MNLTQASNIVVIWVYPKMSIWATLKEGTNHTILDRGHGYLPTRNEQRRDWKLDPGR